MSDKRITDLPLILSGDVTSLDVLPIVDIDVNVTKKIQVDQIKSYILNGVSDVYVTGGTYSDGTTTFTNNSGGTFDVTGFFKTSDDIYTTGLTFNVGNYDLTINKNDGTSYTQSLSILATDMTVTGGTYNPNNGTATFTNNSGGTFNVTGFLTGETSPISVVNTTSLFSTGLSNTGINASGVTHSIFFGNNAGYQSSGSSYSNFIGYQAGSNATNAQSSNFIGIYAGSGATNVVGSNFIGSNSGQGSTGATSSNFIGYGAGSNATNASTSNFVGLYTGLLATNASYSNFFGFQTGYGATNASNSNFIGQLAGRNATNATLSNFIGVAAGYQATNASGSTFIGWQSGYQSSNASNSIFIGRNSAYIDTVNNTAAYNDITTFANTSILIGHKTSTGGYSNSIALGAYAVNTSPNQLVVGSVQRPISGLTIANVPYTLPTSQGSSNTYLKNDGSGNLTWDSISGGTSLFDLGFIVTPNIINQDVDLPDNSIVYYYGDLEIASGYTLNIPTGTTLVSLGEVDDLIYTDVDKNSLLIGGTGNTIDSSVFNTIVLGGVDITGNSSNTVYVPDLVIKKLASVPVNSSDTIGENGSVTWDDDYFYWKANNQWLRLSGLTF